MLDLQSCQLSILWQPLKLSKELEAVTGPGPLGRTDVVKHVWIYIRKHNLQNPENRREILTDDALAKVLRALPRVECCAIYLFDSTYRTTTSLTLSRAFTPVPTRRHISRVCGR